MKKFRLFPLVLLLCLLFSASAPAALALDDPDIPARAAVLVDLNSGAILYEQNKDEQRAPASLTKVMTVLLALEALDRGRSPWTRSSPLRRTAAISSRTTAAPPASCPAPR